MYEGGVRTPAMLYVPFYAQRNDIRIYKGLFHLVDWGPTLLSLVDSRLQLHEHEHKHKHTASYVDGLDLSGALVE